MNNLSTKKILVGLIVVAIIAAGVAVVAAQLGKKAANTKVANKGKNNTTPTIQKKDVESTKLPDKFPTDIPLEANAAITQNFNAESDDGRFQATRSFESKKTVEENFALYQDALKKSGWTINHTIDQTGSKVIFAQKGNQNLQVSIYQNPDTKVVTVNISFTEVTK